MSEALEIQRTIMTRVRRPELKSSVLAALARAWCDVEDRKRILRGIPLPESLLRLDPSEIAKRLKRRQLKAPAEQSTSAFIEVTPQEQREQREQKESLNPAGG